MMDQRLRRRLEKVAVRFRRQRLWLGLAVIWLVISLAGAAGLGLNVLAGWYLAGAALTLCVVALAASLVWCWFAWTSARDYHWVAGRVERTFPDLDASLLAAAEQEPKLRGGRFGFLQDQVIRHALQHAYHHPWKHAVPARRILAAQVSSFVALGLMGGALVALAFFAKPRISQTTPATPDTPVAILGETKFEVTVEPGDTEVERGSSLLVTARFRGPLPPDAVLVSRHADGRVEQRAMTRSLDDPVFGGRIPSVDEPTTYEIQFADQKSDAYQISVFDYPKLVRADAELTYPEYTSLEARLVQDVRHISAVEGTEATLICHLNKSVAKATLEEKKESTDTTAVPLASDAGEAPVYRATIKLDKSRRYRLHLVDQEGRTNKDQAELVVTVLPNRAPDLKLILPAHDVQVSPLEELTLEASVWDDHGLNRYGVSYAMAGEAPQDLVLGQKVAGKERVDVSHVVALEELGSEPDQLLSYHFWAEDTGPDGALRRISSDMFFAEVRPFEEIFRQGESPPGGSPQQQGEQNQQGGQNAQAAQQLAEQQKEIINATWKVIRRTSLEPTSEFADDVQLIAQSQASVLDRAKGLGQRLTDAQSSAHLDEVTRHMEAALKHLAAAHQERDSESLPTALSSEQAAYQALLKLRAREHRVIRGRQQQQQRGSGSGQSSSRSQQQLQQLELNDDENRYEAQRTAQRQQDQGSRENRQVLSRLRELARRQNDVNKRLQELQSALQEARTEQEREELRRQLKRLQEQQQDVLRDTDELQARMDRPENQERMADARQQLDQTRQNVRRASQALEEGMVPQAVSAGTRAERDFRQLQDDFRQQTAGQFDEELRQMREEAQRLDETEQRLAQQMEQMAGPDRTPPERREGNPDSPGPTSADGSPRQSPPRGSQTDPSQSEPQRRVPPRARSLRDDEQRNQIVEELERQKQRLESLLDQARRVVVDAEEAEPLLADRLYDAARTAQQQQPGRALDSARRSLAEGFLDDALDQEGLAREGIQQLREGIDEAADSVLGDETEALRRARDELSRLVDELNGELSRNRPDRPEGASPEDVAQGDQARPRRDDQTGTPDQQPSEEPSADSRSPGRERAERDQNQTASNASEGRRGQPGQRQAGQPQQPNQPGARPSDQENDSDSQTAAQGRSQRRGGARRNAADGLGGFERFFDDGTREFAPIAGDDFVPWTDRLRDVEEMVEDPQLRAEAAAIRDRARGIRVDLRRHSKPPNWDLVQLEVLDPLVQLRDRVAEELLKRVSKETAVPLDRDPVPPKFAEQVRRYYERLGSGR